MDRKKDGGSILPVMEGKWHKSSLVRSRGTDRKRRIKAELSQEDKQSDFSDLDYTCTEDSKACIHLKLL